jgi:hypothetical protein
MTKRIFGVFLTAAIAGMAAEVSVGSSKAAGACDSGVVAHAPGFIPNCDSRDPPGIHRSGERYCARKTETGPDGNAFCPPNNLWISKAEAYRLAGSPHRGR